VVKQFWSLDKARADGYLTCSSEKKQDKEGSELAVMRELFKFIEIISDFMAPPDRFTARTRSIAAISCESIGLEVEVTGVIEAQGGRSSMHGILL